MNTRIIGGLGCKDRAASRRAVVAQRRAIPGSQVSSRAQHPSSPGPQAEPSTSDPRPPTVDGLVGAEAGASLIVTEGRPGATLPAPEREF